MAGRWGYALVMSMGFLNWLVQGTDSAFRWLAALLAAPFCGLLVTLPGLRDFRLVLKGRKTFFMGQDGHISLLGLSRSIVPPFRGKVRLTDSLTGKRFWYDPLSGLPTEHCGGYLAEIVRGRVTDCLGIFSFPAGRGEKLKLTVLPEKYPIEVLPDFARIRFVRKTGGEGEDYDLRPFRTGDSPKSLHWKLSFKTGNPIVREDLQQVSDPLTVDMIVAGSREVLDRKFGQLLWLGCKLLQENIPFRIRIRSGEGIRVLEAANESQLYRVLHTALHLPAAPEGQTLPACGGPVYRIGEDMP